MNAIDIENKIVEIVSSTLKVDVNIYCSRQNTTEWDSLKHISILFAVEDQFSLEFTEEELVSLCSIQLIAHAVQLKNEA